MIYFFCLSRNYQLLDFTCQESQESARTSEDERHFKRKVLLASASAVMGLASVVPFYDVFLLLYFANFFIVNN